MKGDIWSCGGGTQSAAIAALIVRGDLPKPDIAVIADTGREASETWRYYDSTLKPELAAVGVDLVRLPHSFREKGWNTVDLYSGKDKNTIIMPMFTDQAGEAGMLPKYCSNEWKSRPVDRYIRSQGYVRGNIWVGFSIDEMERMRAYNPSARWNQTYPLIDRRMNRGDCIALVQRVGWPPPPRSACWMCPYRSDEEWRHLQETDPKDFRSAIALEKQLQKRDPHVYFHDSCQPLDKVDFSSEPDLFSKPCASGMCFT